MLTKTHFYLSNCPTGPIEWPLGSLPKAFTVSCLQTYCMTCNFAHEHLVFITGQLVQKRGTGGLQRQAVLVCPTFAVANPAAAVRMLNAATKSAPNPLDMPRSV